MCPPLPKYIIVHSNMFIRLSAYYYCCDVESNKPQVFSKGRMQKEKHVCFRVEEELISSMDVQIFEDRGEVLDQTLLIWTIVFFEMVKNNTNWTIRNYLADYLTILIRLLEALWLIIFLKVDIFRWLTSSKVNQPSLLDLVVLRLTFVEEW